MFDLNQVREEINLDNPIFVCYINVSDKSRQRAIELIEETRNHLDIYNNVTMWFVASNRDEIVCVYDGWARNRDFELKDLIEEINNKIEIMSESHSYEDFKIRIRDWRLSKIVDEKE